MDFNTILIATLGVGFLITLVAVGVLLSSNRQLRFELRETQTKYRGLQLTLQSYRETLLEARANLEGVHPVIDAFMSTLNHPVFYNFAGRSPATWEELKVMCQALKQSPLKHWRERLVDLLDQYTQTPAVRLHTTTHKRRLAYLRKQDVLEVLQKEILHVNEKITQTYT